MTVKKVVRTTNSRVVRQPSNTATYLSGPKGDTGATGATGPQGATGATGPQGPAGLDVDGVTTVVALTQAEYDALPTPNADTLYVITS